MDVGTRRERDKEKEEREKESRKRRPRLKGVVKRVHVLFTEGLDGPGEMT